MRSAQGRGLGAAVHSPPSTINLVPQILSLMLLSITAPTTAAWAQGVLTQQEALALAVPNATWQRHTAYLADDDLVAIAEQSNGVKVEQRVVSYYVASEDGRNTHVAYFDAHPVRTLPEVVMVVVTAKGTVDRVEILKFSEPPEYRAPAGWLAQFDGHDIDDDLSLKGEIVGMTGATLTARAVTGAVQRQLAVHAYLRPLADQGPGGKAQ
ncbi:MAG: FMN-binding protein [Gemmatimonadetes bacterium]|nr:MAG: FMN-binding protein [Gemmatimonadota bacterium]